MDGRTKSKKARQRAFLALYSKNLNAAKTADQLGLCKSIFFIWLNTDKQFRKKYEQLLEGRFALAKDALLEIVTDQYHKDRFNAAKMILSKDDDFREVNESKGEVDANINIKVDFE